MTGGASLDAAGLAALMPMHVLVGPTGHVRAAGPTLARLRPGEALAGRRLLELFEFRRPAAPAALAELLAQAGRPLALQFRDPPRTGFKGVLVPAAGGGALLNLSFGIGAVQAVTDHCLTASDFAPTDLTVEMLYLVEAKSAAMEESRRLNRRLERARSAAMAEALTDPLTGLSNRRAMEATLARLVAAGAPFALIHLDLDHFKAVNDSLGHAAGDAVLAAVAQAIRAEVRAEDIAARIGGDEFVLLVPRVVEPRRLEALARRIIARIEEPVAYRGALCRVSASAGIAVSTAQAGREAARIQKEADAALYASKRAGRGRATLHSGGPG